MARTNRNITRNLQVPYKGLNTIESPMGLPEGYAIQLRNFIAYPDRIAVRPGFQGFVDNIGNAGSPYGKRLWVYAGNTGTQKLFATADSGCYDVSTSGARGTLSTALTKGDTSAVMFATGANNYLCMVNGADNYQYYNGAVWTAVAVFGAINTNTLTYVETYRQRLYFAVKNTLQFAYLPPNSITGAATTYDCGAIFRRGGYIVALSTWTLDGGAGPDDSLAIITSEGEVAVFAGTDPAVAANWSMRGVYYIGRPMGLQPVIKFGGDLLYFSETGVSPLSKALLAASVDRQLDFTNNISPTITYTTKNFRSYSVGWQLFVIPTIPLLIANVPIADNAGTVIRTLCFAYHLDGKGWSTFNFDSQVPINWATYQGKIYCLTYDGFTASVCEFSGLASGASAYNPAMVSGFSYMGTRANKLCTLMRPTIRGIAPMWVQFAISPDFQYFPDLTQLALGEQQLNILGVSTQLLTPGISNPWLSAADIPSAIKAWSTQLSGFYGTGDIGILGAQVKMIVSERGGF